VAASLALAAATSGRAEEIEKKFRLAFSIGGYDTQGQIHSAAANARTLFRSDGEIDSIIFDPRNDSGAISNFSIETQPGARLAASYAFNRFWYVELSAGYRTGTVGNVQVQAQFAGVTIPINQSFNFAIFNYDGGTITQVPLEFTAGIRFRPKAVFNPYLCAGFGYTFVSFHPSDDINRLSVNLDKSAGAFARLQGRGANESLDTPPASAFVNLSGLTVDVPDAPEWHLGGGFEFTFHSRWAVFLDARYYTYSGRFAMHVNGADELGISVPNDQVLVTSPGAFGPFGAVSIQSGGLVDGGSWVPIPTAPEGTTCSNTSHFNCQFTGAPDGVPDPGYYYVQAGSVRYNGAQFQIGVKFTF
jgi:hypothetical protein